MTTPTTNVTVNPKYRHAKAVEGVASSIVNDKGTVHNFAIDAEGLYNDGSFHGIDGITIENEVKKQILLLGFNPNDIIIYSESNKSNWPHNFAIIKSRRAAYFFVPSRRTVYVIPSSQSTNINTVMIYHDEMPFVKL